MPTARINGQDVIVVGRWLKTATLRDEEWLEANSVADDPVQFAEGLRASGLGADLLAFSGSLDSPILPGDIRYDYDNVAVIDTSDFHRWWDGLPQEARKNTRRAAKKGIEIRCVTLDETLAAGIKAIYDETPVRQGRPFWHYGKDIETVKRENGTYLERSTFLGAYYGGDLVGFMKWVHVGNCARIMQILCLNAHQDKRPMIALIAKSAEICHEKGMRYLIYGKFTYGRKLDSSIAEFKRRLGFVQKDFPRYYVPLTWRGRLAMQTGLHAGLRNLLPPKMITYLVKLRAAWLQRSLPPAT